MQKEVREVTYATVSVTGFQNDNHAGNSTTITHLEVGRQQGMGGNPLL